MTQIEPTVRPRLLRLVLSLLLEVNNLNNKRYYVILSANFQLAMIFYYLMFQVIVESALSDLIR